MAFRLHLSCWWPTYRLKAEAEVVSASFGQFSVFQSRREGLVVSDSVKTSRMIVYNHKDS